MPTKPINAKCGGHFGRKKQEIRVKMPTKPINAKCGGYFWKGKRTMNKLHKLMIQKGGSLAGWQSFRKRWIRVCAKLNPNGANALLAEDRKRRKGKEEDV